MQPLPDGFGYAVFGKVVAGMDGSRQDPRRTQRATGARTRVVPITPVLIQLRHSGQPQPRSNRLKLNCTLHGFGAITLELDQAKAPKSVANTWSDVGQGPLRQHAVSPRDSRLHGARRRHGARHGAKAHGRAPTRRN